MIEDQNRFGRSRSWAISWPFLSVFGEDDRYRRFAPIMFSSTYSVLLLFLTFLAGMLLRKRPELASERARRRRKQDFLHRNIGQYNAAVLDKRRSRELPQLLPPDYTKVHPSKQNLVYLDYAGAALPVRSQLDHLVRDTEILANPHSVGPAAARTQAILQQVRHTILQHFHAEPQRIVTTTSTSCNGTHPGYDIFFTSGTTEALRIVAERFPWSLCPHCQQKSRFLYSQQSHTSVLGMRELALASGVADFFCLSLPSSSSGSLSSQVSAQVQQCNDCQANHLVALPLECNFTGANLATEWNELQSNKSSNVYTLLDIAKAAATGPVDLCALNPDFACLSFYKLFGAPTGLGCLLVKRTTLPILVQNRSYFGGGAVDVVLAQQDFVVRRSSLTPGGTLHFRGIAALRYGFAELDRVGGMLAIQQHTHCLGAECIRRLRALVHANGRRAVEIYHNSGTSSGTSKDRRSTVSFSVIRADGTYVGYHEVTQLAAMHVPPIQMRAGCMCNPGACQEALGLENEDILRHYRDFGHVCSDAVDIVGGRPTGAVRVSFGKDSLWEDVDVFVTFLEKMFVLQEGCLNKSKTYLQGENDSISARLTQMYIYPIKSCGAQRIQTWPVDANTGKFLYDREFALVDSDGRALRLQSYPKMNLIKPEISIGDMLLYIRVPEKITLVVHMDEPTPDTTETIRVCGEFCRGAIVGGERASAYLSSYIGVKCWLARHIKHGSRKEQPCRIQNIGFANDKPMLLVSQHAVDLLNKVMKQQGEHPVHALHFRPNLVVQCDESDPRNIEDHWTTLRQKTPGSLQWRVAGPCARCSMVDFHPDNGHKGKTLKGLSQYRRENGQISFGIFLQIAFPTNNQETIVWLGEGEYLSCTS